MPPIATSSTTPMLRSHALGVSQPEPETAPAQLTVQPATRFGQFFEKPAFVDRAARPGETPVDVFIPIMHANELWEANLLSIYREIPVHRLILGDAGCIDETLAIARRFPRVEVHDHRGFTSLGYSIRKLIEAVRTEWFVYLHSDVFLPDGWYDAMAKHQGEFDWYECRQTIVMFYDDPLPDFDERAFSGSQMGRKAAFDEILPKIDDDYLYRSEDIVLAELIARSGHRYGRAKETWHYHQNIPRRSTQTHLARKSTVTYKVEATREERLRTCRMQARALVKYLEPRPDLVEQVRDNVHEMISLKETTWPAFRQWVAETNPAWLPHLKRGSIFHRLKRLKRPLWLLMKAHYDFLRSFYWNVVQS